MSILGLDKIKKLAIDASNNKVIDSILSPGLFIIIPRILNKSISYWQDIRTRFTVKVHDDFV